MKAQPTDFRCPVCLSLPGVACYNHHEPRSHHEPKEWRDNPHKARVRLARRAS